MLAAAGVHVCGGEEFSVLEEEGDVLQSERSAQLIFLLFFGFGGSLALRSIGGARVFAGAEEIEEAEDGELTDGCPMLFCVVGRSWHVDELFKDGGVDRPYSFGRRICSGEGPEDVVDGKWSGGVGSPDVHSWSFRVHHEGVLRDDG
jgi:hypothetical protein